MILHYRRRATGTVKQSPRRAGEMPTIIDYPIVLARMQAQGFVSNYFNGGSFAFPKGTAAQVVGHIGPPDPTIRAAAAPLTIPVPAPYEANLARVATRFWVNHLPGPAWLLPLAHWAFELDPVTQPWFTDVLRAAGLDASPLFGVNSAAAVEFHPSEATSLQSVLQSLLTHLTASDFALLFPERPV